ncbi:MFS transporter [Mesorhizobium sp. CAU 1732]|uniref:MFS transporter n=1 Tax=Mesorhizobium sp. CAU 1732 TaxID=3140358 RepID=UPI0032613486
MPEAPVHAAATEMRWLAIGAAIASISVVGVAIGLGVPLLSVILETRGYSATSIGANTAVAGLASIAAAPFATILAARFGVVATMLVMILLGGLSFVGFYFTPFWAWFPLRAVLHFALTVLFILSEFWISASAPPSRRGLVLGLYATVLSLGFAFGPWLFAQVGSSGFLPFGITFCLVMLASIPVFAARGQTPDIGAPSKHRITGFARYIWMVPMATAAVLVFGAVETGGFALFPVYGARIGYTEADAALLLTAVGLGNVLLQIPLGLLSDRMRDRRHLLVACALIGLAGVLVLPHVAGNWHASAAVLFIWGGVVAGLYTIGLAHLGARLSGHDLASANSAFVLCYGIGMLLGPQAIGIGMDAFGPDGFAWSIAMFFAAYLALAAYRLAARRVRG